VKEALLDPNSQTADQFDQLQKIVQYAIEREEEAHQFYMDLTGKVKSEPIAEELRKIAAMELQHKEKLQRMNVGEAASTPARQVLDLQIADYTVEAQPTQEMYWQDLLSIAMHREMAAMQLYQDLSNIIADPGAKKLFEHLAAEEASHKLYFERVWDEEVLTEN
jgi:rubrerythrin